MTLRARPRLSSLRAQLLYRALHLALTRASKPAFRLLQFSVQRDHVHLIVEAADRVTLWRGMQGLAVRLARAVNRVLRRRGSVWGDRYHRRDVRTPRDLRNLLRYVLMNHRKHAQTPVEVHQRRSELDPCSSAAWAGVWDDRAESRAAQLRERATRLGLRCPVRWPRTWLARRGWRRHGLLGLYERPRSTSAR